MQLEIDFTTYFFIYTGFDNNSGLIRKVENMLALCKSLLALHHTFYKYDMVGGGLNDRMDPQRRYRVFLTQLPGKVLMTIVIWKKYIFLFNFVEFCI